MLLDADWRGTELGALVENALKAYRAENPEVVELEGDPVPLTPQQGLGLSLVLHELATNAAKYGALSHGDGRLRVFWRKETSQGSLCVRLNWQERGGPQAMAPDQKGFGSRLIEQTCTYQLEGSVELDYAPEGFGCRIVFPLN
jgi:two-component sensor histidine kinase